MHTMSILLISYFLALSILFATAQDTTPSFNAELQNVLNGNFCLQSSFSHDIKVSFLELRWTLRDYKPYFALSQTMEQLFVVSAQIPLNLNGNVYNSEIALVHHPRGGYLFCDFTNYIGNQCHGGVTQSVSIIMNLQKDYNSPPINFYVDEGFEYEGELWYSSSNKRIRFGTSQAKTANNGGMLFDFKKKINVTEFDSVIGKKSEEDSVEVALIIKQSLIGQAISSYDLMKNCKS